MRGERDQQGISIYLSREEVFQLQAGNTIGDRLGVTTSDAKVEVLPLNAVTEDDSLKDLWANDRLKVARSAALNGKLLSNGDLQVIVPAISLSDVRVSSVTLPREQISTPMTESTEYLHNVIPEQGVTLYLGGSLQVVDLYRDLT
jgi:hypothetical protein